MTQIKICGLTREADIDYVNEARPDYIGFILNFPKSRRNLSPEQAAALKSRLSPEIRAVGVFVDRPAEEIIRAAETVGLDVDKMLKSIGGGAAGSWQMANLGPKMAAGDCAPGFFVKHLIKDLSIASDEAEDRELHLEVLNTVLSMYKDLRRQGMGELGTQAIIAYYDAKGGKVDFDE